MHPCPFPIELPYRLIRLFSLRDELVLDPFMGIGTTARAAAALGRRFVGFERERRFIDRAAHLVSKPIPVPRDFVASLTLLE